VIASDSCVSICADKRHATIIGAWSDFSEDVVRYLNKSPENIAAGDNFKSRLSAILTAQLLCLILYRIGHLLHVRGFPRLGILCSRLNLLLHKITLPSQSCIGPGCFIPHPAGVTFRGRAGSGLTLYSLAVCTSFEDATDDAVDAAPLLGNRVTIGGRAVLLGPIRVGDNTKIYAVRLDKDADGRKLVLGRESRQRIAQKGSYGTSHT
jgi:serine O-acetyltransferase